MSILTQIFELNGAPTQADAVQENLQGQLTALAGFLAGQETVSRVTDIDSQKIGSDSWRISFKAGTFGGTNVLRTGTFALSVLGLHRTVVLQKRHDADGTWTDLASSSFDHLNRIERHIARAIGLTPDDNAKVRAIATAKPEF